MSFLSIISVINSGGGGSSDDSAVFTSFGIGPGSVWDNAQGGSGDPKWDAFSRIIFTTNANQIKFVTETNYAALGDSGTIGLTINGVVQPNISCANTQEVTVTLGSPGVAKTVELLHGAQLTLVATTIFYTGIFSMSYPENRTLTITTPETPDLVVIGDSIANGYQAINHETGGFIALLRRDHAINVALHGWGTMALYDIARNSTVITETLDQLAIFNCPKLWLELQTNDWGRDPSISENSTNYGIYLANFLDSFHVRFPTWHIYFQSAIIRTLNGPDATATNTFGETLPQYRSVSSTVCAARSSYVTFIDGTAIMSSSYLADGLHPNDAGHALIAAEILTHL